MYSTSQVLRTHGDQDCVLSAKAHSWHNGISKSPKLRGCRACPSPSGGFALTAALHFHELVVVLLRAHRVGHRE